MAKVQYERRLPVGFGKLEWELLEYAAEMTNQTYATLIREAVRGYVLQQAFFDRAEFRRRTGGEVQLPDDVSEMHMADDGGGEQGGGKPQGAASEPFDWDMKIDWSN